MDSFLKFVQGDRKLVEVFFPSISVGNNFDTENCLGSMA